VALRGLSEAVQVGVVQPQVAHGLGERFARRARLRLGYVADYELVRGVGEDGIVGDVVGHLDRVDKLARVIEELKVDAALGGEVDADDAVPVQGHDVVA